ncbi:thyroid adenoma-associated protein homolog isoform X2 [Orussus abietinus]|uniref:thyroid adenoma-associated protein homolog isoform X2 n=1 Tax=Orussus abietinus TaxID=222816 RepID=UPI000625768E|nr:thyroid adenoma-associated protein homolog isoform X2 [Orussus abietinus]
MGGAAKRSGELDDERSLANQNVKWRNILDYCVLQTSIEHHNVEIRLEALGLLAESKKSTQLFTAVELRFIVMFLKYHLGEKMEFVPLIKKVIKRANDGLAVLLRQLARQERIKKTEETACADKNNPNDSEVTGQTELYNLINAYQEFFVSIQDVCVKNVYPGSTHCRRKSSLQILCLLLEISEIYELSWCNDQVQNLFECLLLDTYESNKEMAYKILKSIDPHILQLSNETKVKEIINVAFQLGNSIRPIDTFTAAYMFKISTLSPVITNVLNLPETTDNISNDKENAVLLLVKLLLTNLKTPLKLAEENIVMAVTKHSLYGYLFCLRSLLKEYDLRNLTMEESWRHVISELTSMCFVLSDTVSQIVNNSSPEGHLPMDLNPKNLNYPLPEGSSVAVTPQMVLLCSWHTVKEISLLFGYLTASSPVVGIDSSGGLLTDIQIKDIGEHLVTLLCETKHRGAFEQAHVGFHQLCTRLWHIKDSNLQKLPKMWLYQTLLAITGLSPGTSKFCATRRSAGVPFMVQALVTSEPGVRFNTKTTALISVMKILLGFTKFTSEDDLSAKLDDLIHDDTVFFELKDISTNFNHPSTMKHSEHKDAVTEIKTHALNILRALFKHSLLGEAVKPYVADGIIAAIKSYDGQTWMERNAATLLFGALIIRIFGVQRTKDHLNLTVHNKMTGRIFFERYTILLPFMLNELQLFVRRKDTVMKPSVQLILLLLSRLYPGHYCQGAEFNWQINSFVDLVSKCSKSSVYTTRELAARAVVPLLTEETVCEFLKDLFNRLKKIEFLRGSSLNTVHGYMLQILEILKNHRNIKISAFGLECSKYLRNSSVILESLEITSSAPTCFPLATAYVNILSILLQNDTEWLDTRVQEAIISRFEMHLTRKEILKWNPGREVYEHAVATLLTSMKRVDKESNCNNSVNDVLIFCKEMLSHNNSMVQTICWLKLAQTRSAQIDDTLERTISAALTAVPKAVEDIDLLESILLFLYEIVTNSSTNGITENTLSVDNLCHSIISIILNDSRSIDLCEKGTVLRLLGKACSRLMTTHKNEDLFPKYVQEMYRLFLNNSWMGAADVDCRIAVSQVVYDLYVRCSECCTPLRLKLLLNWWTMLLNLLIDDNNEVRENASLTICKIGSECKLKCKAITMEIFFTKFMDLLIHRELVPVAFFVWSMTLSGDADYEMDETDVFNKCSNYEYFEPVRISVLCINSLERYDRGQLIDRTLLPEVKQWVCERLNIAEMRSNTLREIIMEYKQHIPTITRTLKDILDPTYNDKLLRVQAYEKFETLAREGQNT